MDNLLWINIAAESCNVANGTIEVEMGHCDPQLIFVWYFIDNVDCK